MAGETQNAGVPRTPETNREQANDLDLIWGAADIARALNLRTERQAFRMLEDGVIPARKVGRLWVASRRTLQQHFGLAA
jgi:hypothetical protein